MAEPPRPAFTFQPEDMARIARLLRQYAGISLDNSAPERVYSRLSRRLRRLGFGSFTAYLDHLEQQPHERQAFVNALTTTLTAFFREPRHFPLLAAHLQRAAATARPLRLWSAGASTGEEAYSLAMTAADTFDTLAPPVEILASDLNTRALATARRGVYAQQRLAPLSAAQVQRYVCRDGSLPNGQVQMVEAVRRSIRFRRINLIDPEWPVAPGLDAIFCRNVMIYLAPSTRRRLLQRLAGLLKPDGLLFVGQAENLRPPATLLQRVACGVYRPVVKGAA